MNTNNQVAASNVSASDSNANAADRILFAKIDYTKGAGVSGHYLGRDGVQRFVKVYGDPSKAYGEHLANRIYRDLGLAAPESVTFEHGGQTVYASVVIENGERLGAAGVTTPRAAAFMEGFAADVLLANWNVVGRSMERVLVLPGGTLVRAGNRAALLMRASCGRKPTSALRTLTEWDKLRQHTVNPAYADVAAKAGMTTDDALAPAAERGIEAILALREKAGSWASYVADVVSDMPEHDRTTIVEMLEARTILLAAKLNLATELDTN